MIFFLLFFHNFSDAYIGKLNVDKLIENVKSFHPLIKSFNAQVDSQKGALLSSESIFDPVVSTSFYSSPMGLYPYERFDAKVEQLTPLFGTKIYAGIGKSHGNYAVFDTKNITGRNGEISLGAHIPLLLGGWIDDKRTKLSINKIKLKEEEYKRTLEINKLLLDAQLVYWDWVFASSNVKLNQELLDLATQRDGALEKRSLRGDIAKIDRDDNLRLIYSRTMSYNNALADFQDLCQKLSFFIRNNQSEMDVPTMENVIESIDDPKLNPLNKKELVNKIIERNSELKSLDEKIYQKEISLQNARNALLPKLDIKLERFKELGEINTQYKSKNEFKAGIYLEIAIPFRKSRGLLIQAIKEKEMNQIKRKVILDKIHNTAFGPSIKLDTLIRNLGLVKKELHLSRKIAKAEERRFFEGHSNLISVNLREEVMANVAVKYAQIQTKIYQLKARIDILTQ